MKRWIWLDRSANVAIVIASVLVILKAGELFQKKVPVGIQVPAGTVVPMGGVDWAANRLTVLLVLSTDCRFCSANAELYRRIAEALRAKHLGRTVAVLPEAPMSSTAYLAANGVVPDDIRQEAASSVAARATPTILAVGPDGRVVKAWVGRLSGGEEASTLTEILRIAAAQQTCVSCSSF